MISLQVRLETMETGLHQTKEGLNWNQEAIQSLEKKLDASMDGLAKRLDGF